MGFKFRLLVELLEDLERNRFRKASNVAKSVNPDEVITLAWFDKYDAKIKRSQNEGVAFLSCLFPERRPDRCFHMQETRLASVFGRVYQLGTARLNELRTWRERKPADFPDCLANVLVQTEMLQPLSGNEVTLEQINNALDDLAANVPSSAPALRANANISDAVDILTPILRRLDGVEAKWLVRMLSKSYHPVQIPEAVAMQQFHFLLPDLLAIQNDFGAAMDTINQAEVVQLPERVSRADAVVLKMRLAVPLVPRIGVMIKRHAYYKARSIKHCCQMADKRLMSVEQKYDGEYCQIHIDMSKGPSEQIQIFSKSGRDSTRDRIRLHHAIEASLHLNSRSQRCKVRKRCILEGELLIYNRTQDAIQPFHLIRKHIRHGSRSLNHEEDLPVSPDEQVMIVYYDILLLDHVVCLERPHEERRRCLEHLISPTKGLAEISVRHVVDFRFRKAPEQLREIFASCISQRPEGFIVKPCKDPYVSIKNNVSGIKLKKNYIKKPGYVADVALVGASLDAKAKRKLAHGDLKWNSFYMGCLENRKEVVRFNAKPIFRVIGEVSSMPEHDLEYLNTQGLDLTLPFSESNDHSDISINTKQMKVPEVLFKIPFIVEIFGSGYVRAPNATYWTLCHPRLHKIYGDRSITESVSFDEIQDMAKTAQTAPFGTTSQEDCERIESFKRADPKNNYVTDKSQSTPTTPGQSPESITPASLTPIWSVHKSPPFAIWSDTSQIPEVANRAFSQESCSPPESEMSSAMKRRCDEDAVILRRKKQRKATPNKTPKREALPATNSSSQLIHRITPTLTQPSFTSKRSFLKRTPPWCKPSTPSPTGSSSPLKPPSVFRASSSRRLSDQYGANGTKAVLRKTLTEVINLSRLHESPLVPDNTTNSAKTSHRCESSTKDQASPPDTVSEIAKTLAASGPVKSTLTRPRLCPLPTLPSTGEEICNPPPPEPEVTVATLADVSTNFPSNSAPPDNRPLIQLEVSHPPSPPGAPFFLTSPLRHLSSPLLTQLLWSSHASISYTSSQSHFLSHAPLHPLSIVLVDPDAQAVSIAGIMRELVNGLAASKMRSDGVKSGRVLLLDWPFLEAVEQCSGDTKEALSMSKKYAAGCLMWSYNDDGDDDDGMKMMIRDCFDWKEAIALE